MPYARATEPYHDPVSLRSGNALCRPPSCQKLVTASAPRSTGQGASRSNRTRRRHFALRQGAGSCPVSASLRSARQGRLPLPGPGDGPPSDPDFATVPGAPTPTEPGCTPVMLDCPPAAAAAGFCFCAVVLGTTGVPTAGPDVIPFCCWARAGAPKAREASSMPPATYKDLGCVVMGLPYSVVMVFLRIPTIQGRLSATPIAGVRCTIPTYGKGRAAPDSAGGAARSRPSWAGRLTP